MRPDLSIFTIGRSQRRLLRTMIVLTIIMVAGGIASVISGCPVGRICQ